MTALTSASRGSLPLNLDKAGDLNESVVTPAATLMPSVVRPMEPVAGPIVAVATGVISGRWRGRRRLLASGQVRRRKTAVEDA